MVKILCFILVTAWCGLAGATEVKPVVLFDQAHNQRFLIESDGPLQLSGLAAVIRANGGDAVAIREPLTAARLANAAALVISGPFEQLKPEEVSAVTTYLENGGRLAVMLHIGPPLDSLLEKLDVDHTNMVLHERRNVIDEDLNFRVTGLGDSPLFSGITSFSLYGVWGLNPGAHGHGIAATSDTAWVDMNGDKILSKGDLIGSFDVVVQGELGKGGFVVFGDDAIFQNRYLDDDNRRLAMNLAGWLLKR